VNARTLELKIDKILHFDLQQRERQAQAQPEQRSDQ
jgi:hypothetical protein